MLPSRRLRLLTCSAHVGVLASAAAALLLVAALAEGQAPSDAPLRVEITSDDVVGNLGPRQPMYCGVPLARGVLQDAARVRIVTAAGDPVPAQVRVLSFWAGTRDIRWLGVDFLSDPAQRHFLEVLPAPRPAPVLPDAPLLVEEEGGFRICTGPALFFVPRRGPLLARASLDLNGDGRFTPDEEILRNDAAEDLYVVDSLGRRAVTVRDLEPGQARAEPEVAELARQGDPVHVCIRREGWYVTEGGNRTARHVTRLHFYRGMSFVRIEHSLILTEDTSLLWFRDIGLSVRHRISAPHAVVFDASHEHDDTVFRAELGNDGSSLSMFQEKAFFYSRMDPVKDCRFEIARRAAGGASDILTTGGRCGEWVAATGPRAGLTLALRNLWQQFPKELEAAPGVLTAHLWSNRGGRELDLRVAALRDTWPKEWFNAEYWGSGSYGVYFERLLDPKARSNGLGMAKTHELLLLLHPAQQPVAEIARTVHAFAQPVLCLADPRHLWKTEAMEPLHPYDPQRFPREEAFMEAYFDQYAAIIKSWGDYGFLDFGAGPHVWYRQATDGPLKGRWMPYVARYSGQIDYGFHAHLWRMYARSGIRKYYDLAEELNRQRVDMGMVHWDDATATRPLKSFMRGKYRGGFAASDSPIYWGNSALHHESGTNFDKFYWFYYLRDYRFAREASEDYCALVKRIWREHPESVFGSRPFAVLTCLATLYRETGDEEILAIGRAGLEKFADLESPRGTTDELATGLGKWDVNIAAVVNWCRATGDTLAGKSVLRAARTHADSSLGEDPFYYFNSSPDYLNLAYRLSGDPAYLRTLSRNRDIALDKYFDSSARTWRALPVASAAELRYPMGGLAVALDALVRTDTPVEPIPQAQQSGFGPPSVAVFRKASDAEATLYVRSRRPLNPAVLDLEGKPVPRVACEPISDFLLYTAKPSDQPASFRVRVPAGVPAGDYVLDPGARGPNAPPADRRKFGTDLGRDTGAEHWEITWSTASQIVLFAPNGLVTGCGRVWESWPPHLFRPGAPIIARTIEWHFAMPQGQRTLFITATKPIHLSRPDGAIIASAEGKTGTFVVALPADAPEGLWRVKADEAACVFLRDVPPVFAADLPARYFQPDLSRLPLERLGLSAR